MGRRLTLTLEPELIESARRHARRSGKSVSRLVAEYIEALDAVPPATPSTPHPEDWPVEMRGLVGLLAGHDVDIEDYHRHLVEKYG